MLLKMVVVGLLDTPGGGGGSSVLMFLLGNGWVERVEKSDGVVKDSLLSIVAEIHSLAASMIWPSSSSKYCSKMALGNVQFHSV